MPEVRRAESMSMPFSFSHDIHMIRHLKIRHKRLAEALDFNVLAVILADRHARIDDLRDDLHALLDLGGIFLFQLLQMRQLVGHLVDLRLGRLGLILLSLLHQAADFLGEHFALVTQAVGLLHSPRGCLRSSSITSSTRGSLLS